MKVELFAARDGFTLLELLVVMAIISILASISLPQFSSYRKRGYDTRAISDLRNVATAEEAYFLDAERYLSCANAQCTTLPGVASLSKGVVLQISAQPLSFSGTAKHPQGSGKTFVWDSERGGLQN